MMSWEHFNGGANIVWSFKKGYPEEAITSKDIKNDDIYRGKDVPVPILHMKDKIKAHH